MKVRLSRFLLPVMAKLLGARFPVLLAKDGLLRVDSAALSDQMAARQLFERAVQLRPERRDWLQLLVQAKQQLREYAETLILIDELSALGLAEESVRFLRAVSLEGLGQLQDAITEVQRACELKPANKKYGRKLADLLRAADRRWHEVAEYRRQLELSPKAVSVRARLAQALEELDDFDSAVAEWAAVVGASPHHAPRHFRYGRALKRVGQHEAAARYLSRAIEMDEELGAGELGLGVFAERLAWWTEAEEYYEAELKPNDTRAELWFRLGQAREHCFNFEGARQAYEAALQRDPNVGLWNFRLGQVRERQGDLEAALSAYTRATADSAGEDRSVSAYRRGLMLFRAERYQEAVEAFETSQSDTVSRTLEPLVLEPGTVATEVTQVAEDRCRHWFGVGLALFDQRKFVEASRAFRRAEDQSAQHRPVIAGWIGRAWKAAGEWEQAAESLQDLRDVKSVGIRELTDFEGPRTRHTANLFSTYVVEQKLRSDVVLFEHQHGSAAACSPYALYQAMRRDLRFADVTFCWVFANNAHIPTEILDDPHVVIAERDSYRYRKLLATAGFLVNNVTFPSYYFRRDDQKYLNTWHGTPIKALGRDVRSGVLEHANAGRNFLQATHLAVGNQHTADVLLDGHDITELFTGKIGITGLPRTDLVMRQPPPISRADLGLADDDKPLVFYAPTWRGTLGASELDAHRLVRDLEALAKLDVHVVFRAHHLSEALVAAYEVSAVVPAPELDTNEILAITDILVTDYSSVLFDFMPRKLPILLYTYDVDEYSQERGFCLPLDSIPAQRADTIEELCDLIEAQKKSTELVSGFETGLQEFCPRDDGGAAARTIEFFFFDDDATVVEIPKSPRTVMFTQSLLPNGITSSFLNLVASLDREDIKLSVLFPAKAVWQDQDRTENFQRLPRSVRALAMVPGATFTEDQRWAKQLLRKNRGLVNRQHRDVLAQLHEHDALRLLGPKTPDVVVDFDGYSATQAGIVAFMKPDPDRRLIYLHSDMQRERRTRFPYLQQTFSLYREFDGLVSVSDAVNEQNQLLVKDYPELAGRFMRCNNVIDPHPAIEDMPLDQDIADFINSGDYTFVSVGRLSPEKGQDKLLEAFVSIASVRPSVRLLIVGAGPLESTLQSQIASTGLSEQVMLAGWRFNPERIMAECDCFVLSSEYEGQGLVVLEALTVGIPVVSTDIPAVAELVDEQSGILVNHSADGLAQGMSAMLSRGTVVPSFDAEEYQRIAVQQFLACINW